MYELKTVATSSGRYTVALRLDRPWRPAQRKRVEAVLRACPWGHAHWDKAGVIIERLFEHNALKLQRALALLEL